MYTLSHKSAKFTTRFISPRQRCKVMWSACVSVCLYVC